jgi:hypothetical protein
MSYQANDKPGNNEKAEITAEDTMKEARLPSELPAIREESAHEGLVRMADKIDTVTLEQAFLDLLDTDRSGITLEINEDGMLESVKKGGVFIKEADLKVYQLAYERLREYVDNEKGLREEARAMEMEILEQKRRLYELKAKEEILEEVIVDTKESEAQLVEMREKYKVTVQRLAEELEEVKKEDVLRKTEAIEELSEQKVVLDMYRYLMRIEEANQHTREEFERKKAEYLKLIEVLNQRGRTLSAKAELQRLRYLREEFSEVEDIPNGKLEFMDSDGAQRMASQSIMALSKSTSAPLIVVDGKLREDWGFADVDNMDKSRIIRSLVVTPADRVYQKAYKKLMDDRDVLVEVETASGANNYQRPTLDKVKTRVSTKAQIELKKEEQFSKMMLEQVLLDELVENGWSTMSLSTEVFMINGQKQSNKMHKKYLKMYKEFMGKALSKNTTIEFQE